MKRTLLGLAMLCSLALAAAPKANATALPECGHSYAIELHGTEPSSSNDAPLHYIVGVGQISFHAAGDNGPTGCTVTGGEMIYNDADYLGFSVGPAGCYLADSFLGGGVPCFDGQPGGKEITGDIAPSTFGGGAGDLFIGVVFGWINGGAGSGIFPLEFTLQGSTGGSTIIGSSVPDPGPNASPGAVVLAITLRQQSSTVVLPVTGPAGCGPLGCTGGGGNGYGVAPYVGLSTSLFQGFSATSSNTFAQPITGSFGSSINSLQIFTNGQAGGLTSFNNNDNIHNLSGQANVSCDTQLVQTGNFADGTSNNAAAIVHSGFNCPVAGAHFKFTLGAVAYGTTDTNSFDIITGIAADFTGGGFAPAGLMSDAVQLASTPAGKITNVVGPTTITAPPGTTKTGTVKLTNTSPAGCDVTISMPSNNGGVGGNTCSMEILSFPALVMAQSVNSVVKGDTPSTEYVQTQCSCNGTTSPAVVIGSTLTITSSDCPLSGTTSYPITCKN